METGLSLREKDFAFANFADKRNSEQNTSSAQHLKINHPQAEPLSWFCARTKPKHEHIAAANLRKYLNLEVFLPRIEMERATRRRNSLKTVEPLFPCYIFVRCVIGEKMNEIRHANGISSLVRFGNRIPVVADSIIAELRSYFADSETITVQNEFTPGEEIYVNGGAFAGMRAFVLKSFPSKHRVQILLDVLGRSTPVEVDRNFVMQTKNALADLLPALAAAPKTEQVNRL